MGMTIDLYARKKVSINTARWTIEKLKTKYPCWTKPKTNYDID
jgi:hypothetical protein